MTITEAAACGTPAVATRIAGHSDAVVDERTGLLVDDADELGAAIERVLADDALRVAARDGRARARAAVHVGRDRARHARGPGRRGASRRTPVVSSTLSARRRADRRDGVARSATRCSRSLAYVPPCCAATRARSRPTPSSTSTSIPAACCRARCRCGTRTSGWARSRTRTSATCSRWARTTGSSTSSASPTGSRNGSGSARSCSSPALGVLYLLRTFGLRGPGVVVAALAYMFTPYTLDYSARISVLLLPWAALPWMIGLTRKALRDGGWRYPAIFALVVQVIGGVNATALIFAGVGPVLWIALRVARRRARSTGGARSASRCASACSRCSRRCGGSPASRCRARTASTS